MAVRDGRLSVFAGEGKVLDAELRLPPMPDRMQLDWIYREHIKGKNARYAVIREKKIVRAMYLARDLLPRCVRRLGLRSRIPGRWATTAVALDERGGRRAIQGPGLFFRVEDLAPDEVWMEPLLSRFGEDVTPKTHEFDDGSVREWWAWDELWLHADYNGTSRFYGAGNTPLSVLNDLVANNGIDGTPAYLWGIGAIPLE